MLPALLLAFLHAPLARLREASHNAGVRASIMATFLGSSAVWHTVRSTGDHQ